MAIYTLISGMSTKRAGHWRNDVELSDYLTPVTGTFVRLVLCNHLIERQIGVDRFECEALADIG